MSPSMCESTADSSCLAVAHLLPWRANGTLTHAQSHAVDAHAKVCSGCSALLRLESRVVECIRSPRESFEPDTQAAWERLEAQLDVAARTTSRPRAKFSRLSLIAVLGVQAAAIGVLAFLLVQERTALNEPRFHTLSQSDSTLVATGPLVRIAFEPGFAQPQAQDWVAGFSGRIVAGPTASNVYTIALEPGQDLQRTIQRMRERPEVLLVERVVRD